VSELEEDEELEELKRRRLQSLGGDIYSQESERRRLEQEKRSLLRTILEPDARARLDNLRIVRPDFTSLIEDQLIALYQQGRIEKVTDEQLKALLYSISARQRSTSVRIEEKRFSISYLGKHASYVPKLNSGPRWYVWVLRYLV